MLLGLVKTETDNENRTTVYTCDNIGRVTSILYPNSSNINGENYSVRQEYTYTDGYNQNYSEGIYGGISGTTVDSRTIYTNTVSNTPFYYGQYSTIYDGYGNLRQESLWNGTSYVIKSKYTYDNQQRVITSTDAVGNTVQQSYNVWGKVKENIDSLGNLYVSDYDILNNKSISYFVASANAANYRANTSSNTYKEDYTEAYFDQFGRAVSRKAYTNWPDLSSELSELYSYDYAGNLTGYTDPKRNINEDGYTASYKYDELSRVTEVKDAINQITAADYTILGNVALITLKESANSSNMITLYTKSYNELGSILSKTDPSSQVTSYSYNSLGLNTKLADRNGSTLSSTYDEQNKLTEATWVSSNNQSSLGYKYCYSNPYGYTSEQLYNNGTLTTQNNYSYDAGGQVTQKNVLGASYINSNLKLQYDDAGSIVSLGAGVQDSNYFYSNYKYTGNRLTSVQTNGLQAVSTLDTENVTYEYYPDGKLKKITYPKLANDLLLTTEYFYNALGRLTSMSNKKGSIILSQFSYTYDANGNILSVNDGQATTLYTYDKLNRLIQIQPQTGDLTTYSYDLRGNRLTESSNTFIDHITNTGYTYNLENKLSTVTKGTATTTMAYYADGLRAKKQTASGTTHYIYNQSGKLVAEA